MQVKCTKGTSKLVEGAIYNVTYLYNNLLEKRKRIYIEDFGSYNVFNFTLPNNSEIPPINWIKPQKNFDPSTIRKGDILVCMSNRYKYLTQSEKYKIEDVKITNTSHIRHMVKFEGYNRFIELNRWAFRTLSVQELRDVNINELVVGRKSTVLINTSERKVDISDNKDKLLLEALFKSSIDKNRHMLDIIDWCCKQSGRSLSLERNDFKELLNLPLSEVLKKLECENNT